MFNSTINSSWSKGLLVLLSVLFSKEGKRSEEEGKPNFAVVLEIKEFVGLTFGRWEIECRRHITNYNGNQS